MLNIDISAANLHAQAEDIWNGVWTRLYYPKTKLIYDYITSTDPDHFFDAAPTPDEISRQFPNACGWGTGMEDSSINGGAMLSVICDRYAVTNDSSLRERARDIMDGLYDCATIHGVPGFVARSICPSDGKSVYHNSSRDQYTHLVHGFWKLWHSPLADGDMKERLKEVLVAVAQFTERSVTPANNYSLLMLDGTPAPLVCQMWSLKDICPHEAARLPMIYAAAYDVSGDKHFLLECEKYLKEALEFSCQLWPWPYLAYALLQMACSLEILRSVFPDGEANALCRRALNDAAERVQYSAMKSAGEYQMFSEEPSVLPDWRTLRTLTTFGYVVPQHTLQQTSREAGEAALVQMMAPDFTFTPFQQTLLKRALGGRSFKNFGHYGTLYLMAAYWRMRRQGLL